MKQLKGLVENYAKWKIDLFCVFSKVPEVWLECNASLLSLLRQTEGFFCFSFNKTSQKNAAAKTWAFCIRFFWKMKCKTAKKNAAQCISSNLKATSKNSGTFENTKKGRFST